MFDATNQRILLFGDSLSSGERSPGGYMLRALRAAGAAATRVDARVGRSAHNFFRREDHARLLAADVAWRPTIAIVWLGTNDIGLDLDTDAAALARIRDVLGAEGARVVAVTPPAFPTVPRLRDGRAAVEAMIRAVFTEVADAGPVTPTKGRTADGVHFTSAGARVLGSALAQVLAPSRAASVAGPLSIAALGLLLGGGAIWTLLHRASRQHPFDRRAHWRRSIQPGPTASRA